MSAYKNVVLFVDDESHILAAIRRAVIDEPFEALFAGSAHEALKIIEERSVSVIVTDMRMPVMDGLTLLKIVREKQPKTIRMVLSGYTQLSQVLATVNQGEVFQFISKPWQMEAELLVAVRQAIDRYTLEGERDGLREGLVHKNQAYLHILRVMEQKMVNEKKDLAGLKNLNHWMFSFWKKHLEMCSGHSAGMMEGAAGHLDLIEKINLMYMSILPTIFESRSLEKTISKINKVCDGRLEIQRSENDDPLLNGYYGFLEMVFKIFVDLQGADSSNPVLFSVSVEPKEPGSYFVIFEHRFPVVMSSGDWSRWEIGYAMMNEIGKAYRVRLLPQVGSDQRASLRVIWQGLLENEKSPE